MSNEEIEFHQMFLDTFTKEEFKDIIRNAMVTTENVIIISTEKNFFELSANMGSELNIYCDSNNDDTKMQLTKDEFMKLYKDSPLIDMQHISADC